MNIRPKIYKFQNGTVPQWYIDRYGGRTALKGWDLNLRYNYSNENLNKNDHRNAGDLNTVFRKNHAYTITPGAITSDILAFYDSDGNGMSAEDFVNFYNKNAAEIRGHWNLERTYNASTAGDHNRLFRRMFQSRSDSSMSPGSDYNIGYLEGLTKGGYNIEDIEGSSTWLRRMDQYENEFDPNNPDSNRVHTIKLKDGTFAQVYKKANGDIALLPKPLLNTPQTTPQENQKITGINPTEKRDNTNDFWNKLSTGFKNIAPDLLEGIRLAGTLYNNERIFDESKKAIIPNLLLSYHTHRQVVGDEATKQAYYRRAVLGLTRAAQPFTSDADRLMAYLFELKRIGDELRAEGDLADNLRIRETSAESSAHADANRERDTAVANSNLTELIKARAARHLLLALKYLADWTNIDLALLGQLAKLYLKKSRQEAIEDLIKSIQMQEALLNDTNLTTLKDLYDKIWSDPKATTAQKMEAARKYRQAQLEKLKLLLITYGKLGTKITHKDSTPKFLYKTSKDIVEHFRRMSKMTDDSRIKTMPKPIKLSSHPKTKKMLMGGIAPFYVYRPFMGGGETTTLTETGNSKSSKNTAAKDKIDMLKALFLQVEGLPIDVTAVYLSMKNTLDKARLLGEELSSDDIAAMYLSSMNDLAKLKYSLKAYNDARSVAAANDALGELAVGANGEMVLLDKEGNIKIGSYIDWKESEGKLNPLTNELLLTIRAHSPNLAFNDKMFDIVANGVGMTKIASHIKSIAGTIGSMELKLEGISEVESRKIKSGLLILAGTSGTPDGFYLVSTDKKDSSAKVNAALNYIYNMLPNNYKTILEMHSGGKGKELIGSMLTSLTEDYIKLDITPLTGKASKDSTGNGGKGGSESSAGLAFVLGQGPRELIDFNTGTSNAVRVLGIKGVLQTHSKENLGLGATLLDASKSQLGGYLQWQKATFGGSKLNSQAFSHIILNDSTIMGMDLPFTTDINGNEVPDFLMLRKLELADLEISLNNIKSPNEINTVYLKYGLPAKFDLNGNLNTMNYKRFAAIQVTLDESSLLNKDAILSDEVTIAGEIERDLYVEAMKKSNKNYDLSNGMWFTGWGKDLLYKGTVFIPYSEDVAFAALSSGEPFKQNLPDNAATILQMLYTPKVSLYKTPDITLSQIKNN